MPNSKQKEPDKIGYIYIILLCEMYRGEKCIEAESRLMVVEGLRKEGMESNC